ncbi:CGNR zinc finger domain-containing protein [Sphaerisporangium aureirubrum]|uniref:CGNR zinc finger domain-containing protein n=1 Tax=Sphaerisporangium aureirubrum TaxID=1544736 RepID=A0ABW1NAD0_9ACTN
MWSVELRAADRVSPRLGGRLCLAVVNSVLWRRDAEPRELLTGYPDLVEYLHDVGGLTDAVKAELGAEARQHPEAARDEFARAIALREHLFGVMTAAGRGERAGLGLLDEVFRDGMSRLALGPDGRPGWTGLRVPAWETAASAVTLLTGPDLALLKQCPGERCGWLFVDQTRNKSRTWCDSRMCGNRDRVRRHYRRTRSA